MAEKLTASDVLDAIWERWPNDQWVRILEAPDSRTRMGRKIDLLCMNCWSSKRYVIEAVEIKVSAADCRKEFADPSKSEFWYQHSDRFWLALPSDVYKLVKHEVPDGWGVITVSNGKARQVKAAPKTKRVELTHTQYLGLLRAAVAPLKDLETTAERRGYDRGYAAGEERAKNTYGRRAEETEALVKQVNEFNRATGLEITPWTNMERLGEAVRHVQELRTQPDFAERLRHRAERITSLAEAIDEMNTEVLFDGSKEQDRVD